MNHWCTLTIFCLTLFWACLSLIGFSQQVIFLSALLTLVKFQSKLVQLSMELHSKESRLMSKQGCCDQTSDIPPCRQILFPFCSCIRKKPYYLSSLIRLEVSVDGWLLFLMVVKESSWMERHGRCCRHFRHCRSCRCVQHYCNCHCCIGIAVGVDVVVVVGIVHLQWST